ncbi:MAG TPA: ATP-binding cassette domain-containing protein [Dehalococcoidia bacterium]|nr:ATP-binding cassette domain-containing protein [Dehalococcoidia bacterium]
MIESQPAVLQVRGLTKVFGSGENAVRAVDGVDLEVHRGEVVLIMGPSGSGKTTLLTMIGGLLRPTSGVVAIEGIEITAMSEAQLPAVRRQKVGFIFQTFNLLEALTALENVEVALNVAGVSGAAARNRAHDLLLESSLQHRLHFYPRQLSGGEKQRVSIARALANRPLLVLADEPTANLDSKHGHDVAVLLRDIAREQDRAVVIVSHDQRIRELADRVLWLEDGRFKDIGRLQVDPVCGMAVEPEKAATLLLAGTTFYFCSEGCRREFQEAPERFLPVEPS